MIDKPTLSLI